MRAHLTLTDRSTRDSHTFANAEEAIADRTTHLKANGTPYTRDGLVLRWTEKNGAQDVEIRYENLPGAQKGTDRDG